MLVFYFLGVRRARVFRAPKLLRVPEIRLHPQGCLWSKLFKDMIFLNLASGFVGSYIFILQFFSTFWMVLWVKKNLDIRIFPLGYRKASWVEKKPKIFFLNF